MTNEIYKSNEVQLRQQIQARLNALSAAIAAAVSDTAYAVSWNGVTTIAPSKNAVYDKIETLVSDTAYDATTWNAVTTIAPSKNAVRDQIEVIKADYVPDTGNTTIAGVKTFSSDPLIPDEVYGVGWNGSLEPPTKNAVYDKIETITSNVTHTGEVTGATTLTVDKTAISNRSLTTLAPDDLLLFGDASNSDVLAKGKAGSLGRIYRPGMMGFDGSTSFYHKTGLTYSGNTFTCVFRFLSLDFSGDIFRRIVWVAGTGGVRFTATVFSNNIAGFPNRRSKLQVDVQTSAGVNICKLITPAAVLEQFNTVFFEFNSTTGVAEFIVNGVTGDDAVNPDRVAPTTGTLPTASGTLTVGATDAFVHLLKGSIGFFGYRDVDGLSWSDFMYADGSPKHIDDGTTWPEWGAVQPLFWNPHGQMDNNLGSAGDMVVNGKISVSDETYGLSTGIEIEDTRFLSGVITTTSNSSGSVYSAITGSAVTVEAGKTYQISWRLRTYSAAATTAPRPRRILTGAVGTVAGFHYIGQSDATAGFLQSSREATNDPFLATGNATSTTSESGSQWIDCLFICTTGGTIGLEFISEVDTSSTTYDGDGSYWTAVVRST